MPGEKDLIGGGIHFCATCDGPFYKNREVVVVGGGNSDVEEGLFLTKFASKVTVLEFQDQLGCQPDTAGEGRKAPKYGENAWQGSPDIQRKRPLGVDNRLGSGNRETEELFPAAAFIFIGLDPNTTFVKDIVEADK